MRSSPKPRGRGSKQTSYTKAAHSEHSSDSSQEGESFELQDVERMASSPTNLKPDQSTEADLMENLNHYDIVSTIYHWSSVDIGVKCWHSITTFGRWGADEVRRLLSRVQLATRRQAGP